METKRGKGIIKEITQKGKPDTHGNPSYQIVLTDGFEAFKNYGKPPKFIKAGDEINFDYVTFSGATDQGEWELHRITKIDEEEAEKEKSRQAYEKEKGGGTPKTQLLHEIVEINRIALNAATALVKVDGKEGDANKVVTEYKTLKEELLTAIAKDYQDITDKNVGQ